MSDSPDDSADDTRDGAPGALPARTYLRRRGRMTRGQARALEQLGPRYRLDASGPPLDPMALFGRAAPLGLEIGFGMGQALLDWARRRPDWNLLGVEVYQPGIGATLLGLERDGLTNVRLAEGTAEVLLAERLPDRSLAEVRILFPDPWPKKRHHKRRLVQADLVRLVAARLAPGALLWVATDWAEYGAWITEVLDAEPALLRERAPLITDDPASEVERDRVRTRFENRGLARGHRVWDLRYRRKR